MKKLIFIAMPVLLFVLVIYAPFQQLSWSGYTETWSLTQLNSINSDILFAAIIGLYIMPFAMLGAAIFNAVAAGYRMDISHRRMRIYIIGHIASRKCSYGRYCQTSLYALYRNHIGHIDNDCVVRHISTC